MRNDVIAAAETIRSQRYAGAATVLAAGSIIRGEPSASSDLDLVVVYPTVTCAYRESFKFEQLPVEAFVHDAGTLAYFFLEVDRPAGIPALAQMVAEGVAIPDSTVLSRVLKQQAASIIAMGPPALDQDGERRLRYAVTDLVDDLRDPRPREELLGAGSRLFEELANHYLRSNGFWSAKGKAIPHAIRSVNAELSAKYCESFESLFKFGDANPVIRLAEDLLGPCGGFLFEGYRSDAPPGWRRSFAEPARPPSRSSG